jgi:integrase
MTGACLTQWTAGNVHPRVVSELLGHTEIRTTLDRYSHVSGAMQREAADQLVSVVSTAEKSRRKRLAVKQAVTT